MSLKPGDMNCRIAISYVQSGRGPLGEPLPEKQVESGKAWAKRELVSGRKVRTLDQHWGRLRGDSRHPAAGGGNLPVYGLSGRAG